MCIRDRLFRMKECVTQVELSTAEIKFLIDSMWGNTRHDSQAYAIRHKINDVELERKLQRYLTEAQEEL